MASIVTNLKCELTAPVSVVFLPGNMFSMDNGGNIINVFVVQNGEPVALGGSVSANVIRSDGTTVAITGALEGNKAYIILPQACYAVPGIIHIVMKITEGTTITTIAAVTANVYQSSTDAVVDPGTLVPSIAALIEAIEDAVDSIPVDYSGLLATLATDYSTSKTYKVGDYAWYGGVLKRCIVAITTAESYTAAHWTNAVIGDDLSALKSAIQDELLDGNCYDVLRFCDISNKSSREVDYTWNANKTECYVNGTATGGNSAHSIFYRNNGNFPFGVKPGDTFNVKYSGTKVKFQILIYKNNTLNSTLSTTSDTQMTIPSDASGIDIRLFVESGVTADETVSPRMFTTKTNKELVSESVLPRGFVSGGNGVDIDDLRMPGAYVIGPGTSPNTYAHHPFEGQSCEIIVLKGLDTVITQIAVNVITGALKHRVSLSGSFPEDWTEEGLNYKGVLPNGTDIDTVVETGYYSVQSGYSYDNWPFGTYGGQLRVYRSALTVSQMAVRFSESKIYTRGGVIGGTFYPWGNIGPTYNNNYETTVNENSYTINCSPEITTDTNNFLASTGDNTDRTADIQAMLNTTGVCRLGPGKFMVSGVDVPAYGYLCGCGNSTIVQLFDQTSEGAEQDAYAIKLESYGAVENLRIFGASSAVSLNDTVDANKKPIGKRHGIVFAGTKTDSTTPGQITYYRSRISGVTITRCTGGGITCTGTGVEVQAHLLISNCEVYGCGIGLNIAFYSEFHRISNCAFQFNYFGTVDNGGNNNFACCDFSKNTVGIFIDNSSNQSRNNTHGIFSACSVNHSVSESGVTNEGTALKILGASFGEFFTGVNIGGGAIIIDASTGIRFVGARIGNNTPITITDSTVTIFDNVTLASAPSFTQSNNIALKFTDCYLIDGTVYDPMA